jgi:ketosteroid isomerase-like protein
MKQIFLAFVLVAAIPLGRAAQNDKGQIEKVLATYDQAVAKKDVETVRNLLAPELLVYEHSVRNDGAQDAFQNHLKPEILEGEGLQLSSSDVRITTSADLALVTRQYRVRGTFQGRTIDASGNETQAWKRTNGEWQLVHLHYSHACSKTPPPAQPPSKGANPS